MASRASGKLLRVKQRWPAKKLQLFVKTPLLNTMIPEYVLSFEVLPHLFKIEFCALAFPCRVWGLL